MTTPHLFNGIQMIQVKRAALPNPAE
jgi:hypothetical protein